jgi:hypothetical protein
MWTHIFLMSAASTRCKHETDGSVSYERTLPFRPIHRLMNQRINNVTSAMWRRPCDCIHHAEHHTAHSVPCDVVAHRLYQRSVSADAIQFHGTVELILKGITYRCLKPSLNEIGQEYAEPVWICLYAVQYNVTVTQTVYTIHTFCRQLFVTTLVQNFVNTRQSV